MIKSYKVTAQLNMMAENVRSVIVKANTERKAIIFAKEKFQKDGAFHITNIRCEEVQP